jgi:hypothetical protein
MPTWLQIAWWALVVAVLTVIVILIVRKPNVEAGKPPADPMSDPGVVAALGRARQNLDALFTKH